MALDYLEKFKELDKKLNTSRKSSRSTIYKIIILSSGIIGFSVSLFSVPILQSNLNIEKLSFSWYFFLSTIILGFFLLLIEPRINYAKAWKSVQPQKFPENSKFDFSIKEMFIALCIILISLFHPSNLIYNRVYETEQEKTFKEKINFLVVHWLARIGSSLLILENLIFIIFTTGLFFLILSFNRKI